MSRRVVGLVAAVAATGVVGLAAPPAVIPPADSPPAVAQPSAARVEFAAARLKGAELLPKALGDARVAVSKLRDYTGFVVRQERVGGVVRPEQVVEIRARVQPPAVVTRVARPQPVAGEETSYRPAVAKNTVRFKPAGIDGVRGFQTLALDDPKVLAHTRHPLSEVGLAAVIERVEKVLAAEAKAGPPATVVAAEYTFESKPVQRFEVYADRPHPARYAAKCVLCLDVATKLPVRFEAYDAAKPGESTGELIESQSFVGLKFNTGLGDGVFER